MPRLDSVLRALLPRRAPGLTPRVTQPRVTQPRARRSAARHPGRWVRDVHLGPGGRRTFDVYLPAGRRRGRLPAVVLLHGCTQTPDEFADATRFPELADRAGIVLVAPHQERHHHPRRCWHWYEAAHQRRGAGEPRAIVGIVDQVLAEQRRWRVDPARVYVAGLSAGGGMALILAATHPDLFAAAGAHSAPAYRSATRIDQAFDAMAGRRGVPPPGPDETMAPLVVVQGSADPVVHSTNGERIAEQWIAQRAAAHPTGPDRITRTRATAGSTADGRAYTLRRWYTARRRTTLELCEVQGLGHAWSGGREGGSFADPSGPRAATVMWSFFRRHRLARARVGRAREASAG